jgi:hypothetical protein
MICAGGFFRSKGSARVRRYDKLGNRDLIDDSISTQKTRLVLFRSPGCSTEEKCSHFVRTNRLKAVFVDVFVKGGTAI